MTEKRIKEIIRECINEITDNANGDGIKFNPNQFSSLTQRIKELYPNGTGVIHPYTEKEREENFRGLFRGGNPAYAKYKKWAEEREKEGVPPRGRSWAAYEEAMRNNAKKI